ncbi:hypothetical protein AVEN_166171-1 [Araneus ventricosus]|uniref:Uncharacterized protein n=1 Tax=Araneus ventricosus TaxID=182803 RepID=A0A4Y2NGC2_ARAVE|nr:hypothetical protein AVEN_166171-1 [Araneus ventricosus]
MMEVCFGNFMLNSRNSAKRVGRETLTQLELEKGETFAIPKPYAGMKRNPGFRSKNKSINEGYGSVFQAKQSCLAARVDLKTARVGLESHRGIILRCLTKLSSNISEKQPRFCDHRSVIIPMPNTPTRRKGCFNSSTAVIQSLDDPFFFLKYQKTKRASNCSNPIFDTAKTACLSKDLDSIRFASQPFLWTAASSQESFLALESVSLLAFISVPRGNGEPFVT